MDDYLSKNAQPSRKFTGKDKSSSASAASASASAGHGSSGGDESSSDLISYRTRFRITALDHLNVVSLAQAKKRHELVDTVISHLLISVFHFWFLISSFLSFFLSWTLMTEFLFIEQLRTYMEAQIAFFHQGSNLFVDVDSFLDVLYVEVSPFTYYYCYNRNWST